MDSHPHPVSGQSVAPKFINELAVIARNLLAEDEYNTLRPLLHKFYQGVSAQDLAQWPQSTLVDMVVKQWQLARSRKAGAHLINVAPAPGQLTSPAGEPLPRWNMVQIVTDNRPFLVDSVRMLLNQHRYTVQLTIHPVMEVMREAGGQLLEYRERGSSTGSIAESYMLLLIEGDAEDNLPQSLVNALRGVLQDVSAGVKEWPAMQARTLDVVTQLATNPPPLEKTLIGECAEFLRWIVADNFTFLGYQTVSAGAAGNKDAITVADQLGILNDGAREVVSEQRTDSARTEIVPAALIHMTDLVTITKSMARSSVHRPSYMDLIAVRQINADGETELIHCIVGLFTSTAYNRIPIRIPLLRSKVTAVLTLSGLPTGGHAFKALTHIIDTYPRDDLFQLTTDQLFDDAMGILELQDRQKVKLFVRADPFGRFYSCIVFLPRDRYSREVRSRIEGLLIAALGGSDCEYDTLFSESVLARIQYLVKTVNGVRDTVDIASLEDAVLAATRTFEDHLSNALDSQYDHKKAHGWRTRYLDAFPASYTERHDPTTAARDLPLIDKAIETGKTVITVTPHASPIRPRLELKFVVPKDALVLSDSLPRLENLGLKVISENPHRINTHSPLALYIHEFHTEVITTEAVSLDESAPLIEQALYAVWDGLIENDGFNQLVTTALLSGREAMVIRAYARYLRQIGTSYSETYMIESLVRQSTLSRLLVDLFLCRFDPQNPDDRTWLCRNIEDKILSQLESVRSLDDDRIVRRFLILIKATTRTSYFQNKKKDYELSLKFNPRDIPDVPEPCPLHEIFVYSPRVEACHLRGGPVARGGLRWSDRREDFRTEVLGLVKAQIVKNAVIIPVGSKGGFVVKQPPVDADRETLMREVIACYKTFIAGMLDITDNRVDVNIVPPPNTVRFDAPDPYLVVAADKGTATFSDIANEVSADFNFWLDDAFASGGSVGYDHKKMGITARGGWESVKRHFRELGINTQEEDFTVVGVGDMAGDVFGNGMLLSKHIRLVAAFNHQHIFIDPNPDAASSFVERERLFTSPGTNWADYDDTLISEGGGVFDRSSKSIRLSAPIQALLDTSVTELTPTDLIHALLQLPVDLLWNGGIGTYVKATDETEDDAQDRANDGLRVNGAQLRCKVIGEGGNLGMTQRGRIEYATQGGLCYTDFIDNSAGVHSSDYEVNIKILLNLAVSQKKLTANERNELLRSMTDAVARLVLSENYRQTQAISIAAASAPENVGEHARFVQSLERDGSLDRQLEFLPDDANLEQRRLAAQGLTKPELSVLTAYSKMTLYQALLDSDVPEDAQLSQELTRYFPDRLSPDFSDCMAQHPLKREIVATQISNSLVNRVGPTFVFRLQEVCGATTAEIARAFAIAREVFDIRKTWRAIESLDNEIAANVQMRALQDLGELIERASLWLLRNQRAALNIADSVNRLRPAIQALSDTLPKPLAQAQLVDYQKALQFYIDAGLQPLLASKIAQLPALYSALDIVDVALSHDYDTVATARTYYHLGDILGLQFLRSQIDLLPHHNRWYALASAQLRSQLHREQRALTAQACAMQPNIKDEDDPICEQWLKRNESERVRFEELIRELSASQTTDFAMLSVIIGELGTLLDQTGT